MQDKLAKLNSSSTKTMLLLRGAEIQKIESKLNFDNIVSSAAPSVMKMKHDNYDLLYDFVVACAAQYLKLCYPNQVGIAPVIASDLIETRPSWKTEDFPHLFKFIRQRQDIDGLRVMGNQITIPKFMEMVTVYEEHRANVLEAHHAKNKGEATNKHEKLNELAQRVAQKFKGNGIVTKDLGMGKEFDRAQEERERTGKDVIYPMKNHKDFFEKR